MKNVMNSLAVMALLLVAAMVAFVTPAMAGPFTSKSETCVFRAGIPNGISLQQVAGVFTTDATGQTVLKMTASYDAWKDPVAAIASENRANASWLFPGDNPEKILAANLYQFHFRVGSNSARLTTARGEGPGVIACNQDGDVKAAAAELATLIK